MYLINYAPTMKTYGGMEVSRSCHFTHLAKEQAVRTVQQTGWAPEAVWKLWKNLSSVGD
jgi:hypothetical protein